MTDSAPNRGDLGGSPVTVPDAELGLLILSQMSVEQRRRMGPVDYEALLGPNTMANAAVIIETAFGTIQALLQALLLAPATSAGVSNEEMFARWRQRMVDVRGADGNVPPQQQD